MKELLFSITKKDEGGYYMRNDLTNITLAIDRNGIRFGR